VDQSVQDRSGRAARLMGTTALAVMAAIMPLAAPAAAAEGTHQIAQAEQAVGFDIPAQPLDAAIRAFGRQSGWQVSVDQAMVAGLSSPGVRGELAPRQALQQLLAGTGLLAEFAGERTLILRKASPEGALVLDAIQVAGQVPVQAKLGNLPPAYAGGQVAEGGRLGLLGNRDVFETPFNITSYTAQAIQDQQARTVGEVVADDPSVRIVNPKGGRFEQFSIRGFPVWNSQVAFDGLPGLLSTYVIATEVAERVEILKGPNALLSGVAASGGIGGGINVVPKRAEAEPITDVTLSYGSDAQFGGHLDVGRRFGPEKRFGVRANGVYRNGDTPVELQSEELGLGVLGLDYRGDRFRLAADLGHQARSIDAPLERVSIRGGVPVPNAPDGSTNFTQPWTSAESKDTFGALRGEYDLTPDITAFAAAGARHGRYDFLRIGTISVTNAQGDFRTTPVRFPYREDAITGELGLRARFETGPVRHSLGLIGSAFQLETGWRRQTLPAVSSNIFNPAVVPAPTLAPLSTSDLPKASETLLSGLALADTLSFLDDRVHLTVGGRLQRITVDNFNTTTGAKTTSYDEDALTPALGLVVQPWEHVSLYTNYTEGLARGPIAPATAANVGEVFPPIRSKQVEAGVKMDFGDFATTVSAFQITQPSGITDPNTLVFAVDGEQRNRGIEVNVFGEPMDGVRLLGGVMLIDATLTRTTGGTNDGNTAVGVPHVQVNLGAEWDTPFLPGLTLSGRAIHTGSQYIDAANTREIPDWTRFDIGARYTFETAGTPVTLRANIENLFDADYWASAAPNGLTLGAPRTFLLSTTVNF